jgi:YidC/Oxa1 family membrane protein insertase
MINILIVLSSALFNNFGLTIIVLTFIIRAAMYPLTRRQLKASKGMQELQPKIAELRKKYARDKQKLAQEQMALMKEAGVSPAGCLLPMLIQMPIWIALYQSIFRVLTVVPEDFLNLSRHLYTPWSVVFSQVPLESQFLWLDLGSPDPLFLMPILVGGTMWLQQKMVTPETADPNQQTQSRMMLWMLPIMFAFFTMSFPSGLALYWVASNIITIVMQYYIGGWGGLATLFKPGPRETDQKAQKRPPPTEKKKETTKAVDADIVIPRESTEEGTDDGTSGDKREDGGRSYPDSIDAIKRQSRRSKSKRRKRR